MSGTLSSSPSRRRLALRAGLWAAAAALLLAASFALELGTPVRIELDSAGLRFEVAGSTVAVPEGPVSVRGLSLRVVDSFIPPGGSWIELSTGSGLHVRQRLPRRFPLPDSASTPVGDWWIDRRASSAEVFERRFDATDELVVEARLLGRSLQYTTFSLHGRQTVHCRFRHGLINNDLAIVDQAGATLASASIAPRPAQRALAITSTLCLAGSAAAALLALFFLIAAVAGTTGRAPRCPSLPRTAVVGVTVILAVTACVGSAWVADDVLERLPHVPDSVAYLVQARWILDGELSRPPSPIQDWMAVPFTTVHDGRWIVQYPVGWALLLAGGEAFRAGWLVPPLLGGFYILLLTLAVRELYGSPGLAVLTAVIGVLSPMSTLIFASLMSHAASAVLILLFVWLYLVAERRRRWWPAALAGVALGYAFGIRPLTAIAVAIPFGALLLAELRDPARRSGAAARSAALVGGGLAGAMPTFIANAVVCGNPLVFPYSLVQGGDFYSLANLPEGIRNLDALLVHTAPALLGWGWPLLSGRAALALPLALALVPFLLRRHRQADVLLAVIFLEVALAHLATPWNGLHGFGPRYYFEVFFCLYALSARGIAELASVGGGRGRTATALVAALATLAVCVHTAAVTPGRMALYRGYNNVDGRLERALVDQRVHHAVVVFGAWEWFDWGRAANRLDTAPDADIVFAASRGDDRPLFEHYADRTIYEWRRNRLLPVAPPHGGAPSTARAGPS